jgi:uncharacterized protein (TIGR03067 family)
MRRFILVALVVGLVVGADKPKKDGKNGATPLEGTWTVVSATEDGREREEAKGTQIIFKGKTVTSKSMGKEHKGTIKVDPKNKTIDITPNEENTKTAKGIYQLKGDKLKLCLARSGKDRPKDFTADKRSGQGIMVLKLAKSK